MKKALFFLPILAMLSFFTRDPLTEKEKDYATKFLKETEQGVFDAVKGLSDAQLKFKPTPDRWSVEECVKHIAVSEKNIWGMVDGLLKKPANPDKRSEIKATDEQVIKSMEDRTNKVKTSENFKPENTPYKSTTEAQDSFKLERDKLISYVKDSKDDMRNHVATLPMGSYDAYQLVLFISAHTNRHTQQIEEVKADPNFPKQ
jgi:hypothetical protein